MRTRNWIAAAGLLVASLAQAAPQTRWTVVDLGAGFNGAFAGVAATALNNRGEVAGWAYRSESDLWHHAFTWDSGTLTQLGAPAGSRASSVSGINNRGTIVGDVGPNAPAYYRDGAWTVLGFSGALYAVNDHDTMVGSYNTPTGSPAFMIKDGVFFDLGTLGGSFAPAFAVNNKDVVVGYSYLAGTVTVHGFMYENGSMKDVGTLGGASSYLNDVNDHGVAVGGSEDAAGRTRAVVYDGTLRAIPGLGTFSYARSVNDHGDVVGDSDGHVFLYRDGTVTLVDQLPEVIASGWHLQNPVAINDRGWIVVTGYRNGMSGSALLIPK